MHQPMGCVGLLILLCVGKLSQKEDEEPLQGFKVEEAGCNQC